MGIQNYPEIIEQFIQGRREVIARIIQIADKLDEHHRNVKITKVVTGSTGIFGSVVAVGSLLLAVPTGGLSVVAFIGGGLLGAASTIAHVGSGITENILTRISLKDLQAICQIDERNFIRLNDFLTEQIRILQNENPFPRAVHSKTFVITAPLSSINLVCSVLRVTQGAKLTVKTIRNIGRASIVLNLITLPAEVYDLVVDAKELHQNKPCKLSVELRLLVDTLSQQLLNVQEYLQNFLENAN
ncbi:unnamed protein product [Adineta steineri]|uniref:Uncharacterized protein n=1 Tax=Adineta steineri TaxID=433720 RepID=A0A815E0A2_9BILA|nr:unnamed protein product [Adineta steineri]CAF3590807.1 unnamed protein product [Adineta steineri]